MGKKFDINDADVEELIAIISSLRNVKEARCFLRDLLTSQELIEFAKRWKTAKMLYEKVPYTEIEAATGLSSATVARVSRWLSKGMGGYMRLLKRSGQSPRVLHRVAKGKG